MAVASEASYIVDITAEMPAAEQTIAQLDAITAKLTGAARGSDAFHDAIANATNALSAAKTATAEANTALAAAQSKYAELERAALQSAKAQEKAARLGVVPPAVAQEAAAAQAAVDTLAAELVTLEAAAKGAKAEEERLATTLTNVQRVAKHTAKVEAEAARASALAAKEREAEIAKVAKAQEAAAKAHEKRLADQKKAEDAIVKIGRDRAESLGKVQGALGALGGPLGMLGNRALGPVKAFQELSNTVGGANAAALVGAAGLATLAAAFVAVTAVVAAATIAMAAWAVSLADGAREAQLSRAAVEAMNPEIAALHDTIDGISGATGIGSARLGELAKSLKEAGVAAEAMPEALEAAALAERALGSGGSSEFIAKIKEAKGEVGSLAADAKSKLGGIVAQQMRGLGEQSERLKKNVGEIFGGLDIDKPLNGMQTLVELFDKNTAAGQAMQFLFEKVFQPIIDQAENAAYAVEAFALGFLIGLTKVYIALKPVIKTISELFGFDDTALTDTLTSAKNAGEIVAYVFTGVAFAFGAVFAAIAAVIAPIVAAASAFAAFVGVIYDVNVAILGGFIAAWVAAKDFLGGLPTVVKQIGTDLMLGLANGITGGAASVVAALTGAVGSAIAAAKDKLGIASPSKVFAEIGGYTAEGFTKGVEEGEQEAQSALASMVSPVDAGAAASAPVEPAAAPAPAGSSANVSGNTFNFYGVEGAEQAVQRFEETLTRILEGDAMQAAGAPA